jgi:dehydrodolichyl diphosphate syntase complex subunit NUS1
MTEPDLLILFSPRVDLQGFPPWQLRLTEILYFLQQRIINLSHLPYNKTFNYSVFLRGLQMYDRAEMRLGR